MKRLTPALEAACTRFVVYTPLTNNAKDGLSEQEELSIPYVFITTSKEENTSEACKTSLGSKNKVRSELELI